MRDFVPIFEILQEENLPKICLFNTKTFLILLMSAYIFYKKLTFYVKDTTFIQSNSMRAVSDFFSSGFSFCKIKGTC